MPCEVGNSAVRPTEKSKYPLTPIDAYASWVRDDGLPRDPWLRTHVRVGGRVIATAPRSQTFTASVSRWEEWTDLPMPTSGSYVVPEALAPLDVDRERDVAVMVESNIWVQHRVAGTGR